MFLSILPRMSNPLEVSAVSHILLTGSVHRNQQVYIFSSNNGKFPTGFPGVFVPIRERNIYEYGTQSSVGRRGILQEIRSTFERRQIYERTDPDETTRCSFGWFSSLIKIFGRSVPRRISYRFDLDRRLFNGCINVASEKSRRVPRSSSRAYRSCDLFRNLRCRREL